MKTTKLRRLRGMTLIETVLVLAVGISALVGGTMLYFQSNRAASAFETIRHTSSLIPGIDAAYRSQGDYAGLDTSSAIAAGLIPNSMIVPGGARSAFGGKLEISSQSPFSSFIIAFHDLPQDACIRLFALNGGDLEIARSARASVTINGTLFGPTDRRDPASCTSGSANLVEIEMRKP